MGDGQLSSRPRGMAASSRWWAPAQGVEPAAHMDGMVGDAKFEVDRRGDPSTAPDLASKAVGVGPTVQERRHGLDRLREER
jgi:hypothetical protein